MEVRIRFLLIASPPIGMFPWARVDRAGLVYAILSGAIASGLGYVIWYGGLPSQKAAEFFSPANRSSCVFCSRRRRFWAASLWS